MKEIEIFHSKIGIKKYYDYVETISKSNLEFFETGLTKLDKLCGYLMREQFVIIGGRPASGKTSFLLKLMISFCKKNKRCLFISSEMGWRHLLDKIVSNIACINSENILIGRLTNIDLDKIKSALQVVSTYDFYIYQQTKFSKQTIVDIVDKLKPDVLFVDFIQRFSVAFAQTRASGFSDIANDLKSIALNSNILVIAGSQVDRSADNVEKITLNKLKESGGLEESADKVIFLTPKKSVEYGDTLSLDLAKNRQGRTGSVEVIFHKEYCDFEEIV